MIKTCEICGAQFNAKRSDAKCCSGACRIRKHRGVFAPPLEPPKIAIIMSTSEVQKIITNAHMNASDLSRASQQTKPPLSHALGRVAADFEESLRREGL